MNETSETRRAGRGLSTAAAGALLARVGPNALQEDAPEPLWRRAVRQFQSPLIYILLFALVFDAGLWLYEGSHGWPLEAVTITTILLLNAALGLYQERRSDAALARLRALAAPQAWALRDDRLVHVPGAELVPGDWVRLEAGDRVPADGVLIETHGTMIDEAILTGESVPVDKAAGEVAFSGTLIVRGKTFLEITRTGAGSAMGRLASMLGAITVTKTPLERRLDQLGRRIALWVLVLAGSLGVAGVFAEGLSRAPEMILFAAALAVAAVPEGLPVVLTVALALGVERMARHQAVVRRLAAVEALGSVTVIATDKTGTLTQSRMDVRSLDSPDTERALIAMVLANDADLSTGAGDPLELGLLRFALSQGVEPIHLRSSYEVVSERPFDSAWKFARATVRRGGRTESYFKGAPEVLIARSALAEADRESWSGRAEAYASKGFRVLAFAWCEDEAEDQLSFLGLVLLWDPPRAEVPEAVERAQSAGIRVVMLTGDHQATALAVAHMIGVRSARALTGEELDALQPQELAEALREVKVFARVRPEHKLRLVEAFQARGDTVAMTGDGVNDAAALKRSDVGVAMGQRGSDVSREVSDLVLLDDNFATIVMAIEEGRSIYENVQKFLRFLFTTNLSEVLLVGGGAILAYALDLRDGTGGLLLPLTAAQILWINLMTDGLPALALAFDRTPGVMRQPPRLPDSPLLDRPSLRFIVAVGSIKAVLGLGVLGLVPWMGYGLEASRAATFHFMALGQLILTYPSRHTWTHPLPNRYLHAAVLGGIAIQVAAAWLPLTARLLGTTSIPAKLWLIVLCAAGAAWVLAELISRAVWRREAPTAEA